MAKENKLSESEILIMLILSLYEDDGRTALKLMDEGDITKATVYRNLKRLIKRGFVKTKHNIFYITKAGGKILDEMPDRE